VKRTADKSAVNAIPACQATFTVAQLAERWQIDSGKILGWLHNGSLRGLNVAASTTTRRRWRISTDAVAAFEAARSSGPVPKAVRRRPDPKVIQFF